MVRYNIAVLSGAITRAGLGWCYQHLPACRIYASTMILAYVGGKCKPHLEVLGENAQPLFQQVNAAKKERQLAG